MSLRAFTNAPGAHRKYGTRHYSNIGTQYNFGDHTYEHFTHISDSESYEIAKSEKPLATQGDHTSVYAYYRGVFNLTSDKPYTIRFYHVNGIDPDIVEYDYLWVSPISYFHIPFNYDPFNDPFRAAWAANCRAECINKALTRLQDDKAAILANLGQGRQTAEMMVNSVIKATRVLKAFKRGNISSVPKILGLSRSQIRQDRGRSLASYWLEYSYGWAPLASDIHALQKIVLKHLEKRARVKSTAKAGFKDQFSFQYSNRDNDVVVECSFRTVIHCEIENPYLATVSNMGLLNPASVAWELVPWSFAIDWLVPIGSTLEAMTASSGLKFRTGWISSRRQYSLKIQLNGVLVDDGWGTLLDPGQYTEQGYWFEREVFHEFPQPQFYVDVTPLSSPRALNAIALVRQLRD